VSERLGLTDGFVCIRQGGSGSARGWSGVVGVPSVARRTDIYYFYSIIVQQRIIRKGEHKHRPHSKLRPVCIDHSIQRTYRSLPQTHLSGASPQPYRAHIHSASENCLVVIVDELRARCAGFVIRALNGLAKSS
jgi:hypothetical protein